MSKQKSSDEIELTQDEADRLSAMEKHCLKKTRYTFPFGGRKVAIPLSSADKRYKFLLDISSARLDLKKFTFGTRTKKVISLIRIDICYSGFHRNPDNTIITVPHIHLYRAGFGDKWAVPLPLEFGDPHDPWQVYLHFLDYCKIMTKPNITKPLFLIYDHH